MLSDRLSRRWIESSTPSWLLARRSAIAPTAFRLSRTRASTSRRRVNVLSIRRNSSAASSSGSALALVSSHRTRSLRRRSRSACKATNRSLTLAAQSSSSARNCNHESRWSMRYRADTRFGSIWSSSPRSRTIAASRSTRAASMRETSASGCSIASIRRKSAATTSALDGIRPSGMVRGCSVSVCSCRGAAAPSWAGRGWATAARGTTSSIEARTRVPMVRKLMRRLQLHPTPGPEPPHHPDRDRCRRSTSSASD